VSQAGIATEIEVKLLLPDEAAFAATRARLDALAAPTLAEQTNYYLDTVRGDLRKAQAMFRVRVADGRAIATCKVRAKLQGGVMRATEWERDLPAAATARWLIAPQSRCDPEALGAGGVLCTPGDGGGLLDEPLAPHTQLHVVGALANTRRTYRLLPGNLGVIEAPDEVVVLELDHSRYSVGEDRFELECEHARATQLVPLLQAFLTSIGVHAEPADESKYAQLLRSLQA